MATQPTNLPVPSESARDLKFNAGKIDEFVTSLVNTYIDRFGNAHYTIEGLRWLAQQAISQYGWILIDSFQTGASITLPNQALRDETTGEYYRWDGSLPKFVPENSTPDTTGGVGPGAWLSIGDAVLRSALAGIDGYTLIGELESVADFVGLVKQDGARVKLRSWYAGWASTDYGKPNGGGDFIYQASVPKSKHDGCIYFSPTVPYSATLSEYVTGTGETDPSGSGVWVRDVSDATHVHTDWAGINDGATLSGSYAHGDAVQKVFNAAAELGKHVKLGYGAIHIEKAVSMPPFFDNSASMPRIEGYGINSSYLICYPLGTDNYNISCVLPVNFAQSWGLKDFQIREKNLTRTGYLMKIGRITGGLFERIKFGGGYQQLYAMSVLSCTWIEPCWFSGYRGAKFEAGGTVGSGYASPNANYIIRAQILSMENQGIWVIGATQFRLQGGSIEGCGAPGDTSFRGVYVQGGGGDGTNGLTAEGVYIETCSGYPFYIVTNGNRSIHHTIRNCNFNNNSTQYPVSQVIMLGLNYSFPSGVTSTLEFTGNNCLSVGYTGSPSRPDVYVDQYVSNNQAVLIEYNNRFIPSQAPTTSSTVRIRNSGNAGISGQISTSGSVTDSKNILSATWGSTGACTITANYDLTKTRIIPSVTGSGGFAIVGSVVSNTAVIRVYNATGAAANIAFDIIGLDSSAQFTG